MQNEARPLIIGIAGGSGSGKTYLSRQIVSEVGEDYVSLLSMDQYFKSEVESVEGAYTINFDHPSHLDFKLLIQHVKELRDNKAVWAPSYDFATMTQTERSIKVEPRPVIIVEGLFILAEPMVSLCDLTCFLDVAADERLLGRIVRDIRERQTKIETVIDRYQRFVRPSYQIFVEPTRQNADVVVDFTYHRTFLTQLLIHIIQDYVREGFQVEEFRQKLRGELYYPGFKVEGGFMSLTTDIFMLASAYPEKTTFERMEQPLSSPAAAVLGQKRQEQKEPEEDQ